jgi:hypothetical protein
MANYDGRLKHIHDTDIFYADGVSLGTTATWMSDIADLGADQAFVNIPVHIFWEISGNVSLQTSASLISAGSGAQNNTLNKPGVRSYLYIQQTGLYSTATSESSWTTILAIPWFDPYSSLTNTSNIVCSADEINAMNVGLGSIKRYSRLVFPVGTTSVVTIKAWLRMGLTK